MGRAVGVSRADSMLAGPLWRRCARCGEEDRETPLCEAHYPCYVGAWSRYVVCGRRASVTHAEDPIARIQGPSSTDRTTFNYCKTHDPDTREARRKASSAARYAKESPRARAHGRGGPEAPQGDQRLDRCGRGPGAGGRGAVTVHRDQPPRKLDAGMFPTLPRHGTKLSAKDVARARGPVPSTQGAVGPQERPTSPCEMCGQPSVRPKCGRCWGILSGLTSLRREHPDAYEAFIATIR